MPLGWTTPASSPTPRPPRALLLLDGHWLARRVRELGHDRDQLRRVDGLAEMRLEAGGKGASALRRAGIRAQRGGGQASAVWPPPRLAEERVAVHTRHRDVAEQHVGRLQLQALDRLRGGSDRAHARPGLLEDRHDSLAGTRVVVHEQHPHAPQDEARVELPAAERRLLCDLRRRLRGWGERQLDGEGRSLALALALDLDRAVVHLDEIADDREPETQAAMRPRGCAVALPEGLEDVRQEVGGDPLALVLDGEDGLLLGARQPQDDTAAPGGELDRVREEVPHDLLETGRIAPDLPPAELEGLLQPDLLRLGLGAHRIERRLG